MTLSPWFTSIRFLVSKTLENQQHLCLLRRSHHRCDFSSARCSLQVSAIERVQSLLPYVWLLRWRAWSLHWAISQVLRIKIPKEFLRSGFDWPQWWWEYSFSVLPCVFCHYNIWVTYRYRCGCCLDWRYSSNKFVSQKLLLISAFCLQQNSRWRVNNAASCHFFCVKFCQHVYQSSISSNSAAMIYDILL